MIALASQTWKLSLVPTIQRLLATGMSLPPWLPSSESIDYYRQFHVGLQTRLFALCEQAGKHMAARPDSLTVLSQKLGLQKDLRGSAWRDRVGNMVGGIDHKLVEQTLQSPEGGPSRIFKGRGWQDVVILPFHDMPGRICGLLLVGKEGHDPDDVVYRSLYRPA